VEKIYARVRVTKADKAIVVRVSATDRGSVSWGEFTVPTTQPDHRKVIRTKTLAALHLFRVAERPGTNFPDVPLNDSTLAQAFTRWRVSPRMPTA
jgi:hypothetical protein